MAGEYFPVFGFLLIIAGIAFIVFSGLSRTRNTKTEVAVGGFIGPFPFGFATSKWMLAIIALLILAFLAMYFLNYFRA